VTPLVGILLGAVTGLLSASIGGYVAVRKMSSEIGKTGAETNAVEATATGTVVDAALRLLEPYVAQIERQEVGLSALRVRVDLLESHVSTLEVRLRDAALEVPPRPY
jgi:hypothetical protein